MKTEPLNLEEIKGRAVEYARERDEALDFQPDAGDVFRTLDCACDDIAALIEEVERLRGELVRAAIQDSGQEGEG